jgi:hypothetical protein
MEDRPHFRPSDVEQLPCTRCGKPNDPMELDRLLWCERCRVVARNEAGWWGWVIGLAFAGGVVAYVWGVVHPTRLVIGGWVATVVAAAWIGSKVGRELVFGVMRARAQPGSVAPPGSSEED